MRWAGKDVIEDRVRARPFEAEVGSEVVPGTIWTPLEASGPRPLLLLGHGGGASSRTAFSISLPGNHTWLARTLARDHGFAAAAIDMPGLGRRRREPAHGESDPFLVFLQLPGMTAAERARLLEHPSETFKRQAAANQRVSSEWTAVLDELQELDEVGDGPVGYYGFSLGTALGVPVVANDSRIVAACFGGMGLHRSDKSDGWAPRWTEAIAGDNLEAEAARVGAPVLFLMMWDDELVPREAALRLFDAIGSDAKALYSCRGGHMAQLPPEHDLCATVVEYFVRHFVRSNTSAWAP